MVGSHAMQLDARQVPDGTELSGDVCLIGAGAAGITIARELRHHPGRVILLESGGLQRDNPIQHLTQGRNAGLPYFNLTTSRLRYFGGTTNHWNGECRRYDPIDFEPREGIPHSGWPFTLAEIEPYYQRAEPLCELAPLPYRPEAWVTAQTPVLPLVGDRVVTQILQRSPPTRFGQRYRDDVLGAENVHTYLYANVLEIETTENTQVATGVRVRTLQGNSFRVSAKLVVLAAGGIENARILLVSTARQAAGLGNAHDLVGRFFMEHHQTPASLFLPLDPQLNRQLYWLHDVTIGGVQGRVAGALTVSGEVLRKERLLNFRCEMERLGEPYQPSRGATALRSLWQSVTRREERDRLGAHLREVMADLGGLADAGRRRLLGEPPRLLQLVHVSEQAPNPESRVRLGSDRDQLGQPRVELAWRLTEVDRRSVRRGQEIIAEELTRAGLGRVKILFDERSPEWKPTGQFHHMGTTRMHRDPRQGVVDEQGCVHGMANLFIAGSSVFPTSSSGTPTLLIVALALRLADHLKRLLV